MPANGQHHDKNGYKFTINDRSAFYDRYNAYFEVQFQLQQLADGAHYDAQRITVINRSHSLINHLMIKSAGKIVYDTDIRLLLSRIKQYFIIMSKHYLFTILNLHI